MQRTRLTRRSFLKQGAALSVGSLAAPAVVPSSVLGLDGATPPSARITMGVIGCGSHSLGWNMPQMFRNDDEQIIAVCDVDSERTKQGAQKVDDHYAQKYGSTYRACSQYGDFRDLINRKDIDVVDVITPDHWHAIPALMAIKAGKDVICEKPLTLTVAEGRVLSDAAKAQNAIFQTASENRSIDSYIHLCELVRNKVIGDVRHVKVLLPEGNRHRRQVVDSSQDPPASLNYEMWQGQAPLMPYHASRVHYNFRWNLAYSGGVLTDWGAHMLDLAQWALGMQHSGPVEVEGTGEYPPEDAVWNAPPKFDLHYKYANGITMHCWAEAPGIKFEGSDGWIMFRGWRAPLRASDPAILKTELGEDAIRLHRPRVVIGRADGSKGGEHRDFIDCVKSRQPCYAPAEIGHRTITVAHLGNIAMQLGRKLQWDPEKERFVADQEADAMLSREQREPWTIDNVDSWINVG